MPIAVAIDFGTSRTGYAFAFFGDPKREIYFRNDWPNQPLVYPKNLSNLLYDPEGRLVTWGFSAMHELAKLRNDPRRHEYRHLTGYKMQLKQGRPGPQGPEFEHGGRQFRVVNVIGDVLAEVRKMVIADLSRAGTGLFDESEILWCLTVPAIWSDADKQVMQMAAQKAGLISNSPRDADRLIFALEPEAAALYCQEKDRERLGSQLTPGTRFMVVDAGGGTVDLTVHEVTEKGLLSVVGGSGGECGSTYLDGEFMQHLGRLLGEDLLDRITEEEPAEFLELMRHWEREKCQYSGNGKQDVLIPISRRVGRLIDDSPVVLRRLQQVQGGDDENIHLGSTLMQQLFQPVLEEIRLTVARQFEALGGEQSDYLFFVGGFAASPALERMIRAEFEGRVKKVIVPPEPGKAVVMGATLFALDQKRIQARRSRLTYGCRVRAPFNPTLDFGRTPVRSPNETIDRCDGVFDVFVHTGDLLQTDHEVKRIYTPVRADQTAVSLLILGTESPQVRHADEPGVRQLAKLQIQMPDTTGGLKREVEVTMFFGQTKVRVRAVDKTTGTNYDTNFDFLTDE